MDMNPEMTCILGLSLHLDELAVNQELNNKTDKTNWKKVAKNTEDQLKVSGYCGY